MLVKSKSFALLITLMIMLAATLTWIDNTHRHSSTTDGTFDKIELYGNEGRQRKLLDLSCWLVGKPPGCNTPAPAPNSNTPVLDLSCWQQNLPPTCKTPAPSKASTKKPTTSRPSTSKTSSSPTKPTPPVGTYFYSSIEILEWKSNGYCTNTVPSVNGVPAFGTKEECCQDFAESSTNESYRECLAFEAVELDSCDGLKKDACKGSPQCDYNHYRDECKMMCEGRGANHCRAQDECQYLPLKSFCTMTEEQYQLVQCTFIDSRIECGKNRDCDWNHYALNKQGQCQSKCGREETESECKEVGECAWDKEKEFCNYVISSIDAPTPAPGLSRYCLNIRNKDKCNANLPRCKWMKSIGKCQYACEATTKESDCSAKYCTWDKGSKSCVPKYEEYCGELSEGRCGESFQCEWKDSKGCKPDSDAQKKAFNVKLSDRYIKGNLFNR